MSYYERLGCIPTHFVKQVTEKTVPTTYEVRYLSAEAYALKREQLLSGAHVSLNDRFVRYAAECAVPLAVGNVACVLLIKQGETARIIELCGENTFETRSAAASFCGCTTYQTFSQAAQGDCQGMILPLNETKDRLIKPFDIGLTLD